MRGRVVRRWRLPIAAVTACACLCCACRREPADDEVGPAQESVAFSGYDWQVKAADAAVGPGPNHYAADAGVVEVDENGRLHLRIVQREDRWACAEVWLTESLGNGTYRFDLTTAPGTLDPNVVLGLFTWDDDAPADHYREIDIELARWGATAADADNAQFVVQPWDAGGNLERFALDPALAASSHAFRWTAAGVEFASAASGDPLGGGAALHRWTHAAAGTPTPGGERVHLNLWLMSGLAPTDGAAAEAIVSGFTFTPEP